MQTGYIAGHDESQRRAVAEHRQRLKQHGLARYEVRGLAADKELVRKFAQRLAANDAAAERLRQEVAREVAPPEFRTGKDIWDALRRSPAVGLDLDIEREFTTGRDVEFSTRYLLDTNIVSDALKPRPNPDITAWIESQVSTDLFISTFTVAELWRGILERAPGRRRNQLETWFIGLNGPQALFGERVLLFDFAAAMQ